MSSYISRSFQVLFKVVTKYSLGLSATMKRKDGLTKVIKMFLGDVVYKKEKVVIVKIKLYSMKTMMKNIVNY